MLTDLYIKTYDVLDSTQEEAKRLISKGDAIAGYVITTNRQLGGRGKYGRPWKSAVQDVAITIILQDNRESTERSPQLCYVTAVAVGEAILSFSDRALQKFDVQFRWVNDVLLNNKKASGIIIERFQHNFLLIGIGINLRNGQHLKEYNATSLESESIHVPYLVFIERLLKYFIHYHNLWHSYGFLPIKNIWIKRAIGLNQPINVQLFNKSVSGTFTGLDNHGNLLVSSGTTCSVISAGEVFEM
ncbi:biotin--[acetyl-CoA-carboxylase] ligase [Rickettsiales endosymbiont of Peranema trichophorum]|uniref:biotin--[acetyl-CoA-carboxylase] ligase n=1 Tax=Rickettsiales endosymbiont of Peranema trichophorum TaxID=2486577 RepID=UPI001023312F|nr:biotin--[acetyl-CoA-carboxylase] ligase [Rickettsiales endosymbiont of Peranema trichophorum]RZI47535.1 biotin--[acetyl-CoA-carboxylase] ligase [Rickettsiales endosymbiont of Peranema trichophorum]